MTSTRQGASRHSLASLTLYSLIQKEPLHRQQVLLNFLAPSIKETFPSQNPFFENWTGALWKLDEALDTIHPSWIAPCLLKKSSLEQKLYLSALTASQSTYLKKNLNFPALPTHLTPVAYHFLRSLLSQELIDLNSLVPRKALQKSPFFSLLHCSYQEILRLVHHLGLRDLGSYLRLVIDKIILKNIEQALSQEDWNIARKFVSTKDVTAMSHLGFESAHNDPEKLRLLIQQRGINRLAKTLCQEEFSFIWYIEHIFDMDRGHFFIDRLNPEPAQTVYPLLKAQLLDTMHSIFG